MGFCFGRNPLRCDVVLGNPDSKRVSNTHFCIFINENGILMLEDMSTNGTIVDGKLLKGKEKNYDKRRMIHAGSIISLITTTPEEEIKFFVRIPARTRSMYP